MDKKTFLLNKQKELKKQSREKTKNEYRTIKPTTPLNENGNVSNNNKNNNSINKPSTAGEKEASKDIKDKLKKTFLQKSSFKVRMPKNVRSVFYPICIIFTIIFILAIVVGVFFTVLLTFYRLVYYSGFFSYSPYYDTTTKISGSTVLNIGQLCSYSNQCPQNAYCQGTCKCPDNYYLDLTSGTCTASKGRTQSCSFTYECNQIQRLSCILITAPATYQCDCESVSMYWDSSFSNGGGIISGRCANRRGQGRACSASTQGLSNMAALSKYGAPSSICYCDYSNGYKLNFDTGLCDAESYEAFCHSSLECRADASFCMAVYSDSLKRCIAYPTKYWSNGAYNLKIVSIVATSCNSFVPCNEYQNLICSKYYQDSTQFGTCTCFNKYYYHNSTMCVYGKRYGETCTSASSCVPTTAGMVCAVPFSGASYSVCRCSQGTQYYDQATETCTTLKTYNKHCYDSNECADAYALTGNLFGYGYCGFFPGGSIPVCQCINYYSSVGAVGTYVTGAAGTTCSNVKVATTSTATPQTFTTACVATNINQCYYNQNCVAAVCTCGNSKYRHTDQKCYYKKYKGGSCTYGYECWTSTCTSGLCA